MRLFKLLLPGVVFTLSACGQQHDAPVAKAARPVVATKKATPAKTVPVSVPDFAGTYVNEDPATCRLAIVIERRNGAYFYSCDTFKGPMQIAYEEGRRFFTFQGLKDDEPSEDYPAADGNISAESEGDTLSIQNYGNSMNYYVRFSSCDAKYLKLVKQR